MVVQRIAIIASASGNGKTTLARRLARRVAVPWIELDRLVHGPRWRETPDEILRTQVSRLLVEPRWIIDGQYFSKLGQSVLQAADLVVWLDLPLPIILLRLVRRSVARWRSQRALWNGNRETLHGVIGGPDSLFGFAISSHYRRRRSWPRLLRPYPLVRLRSAPEVARFLRAFAEP